MDRFEKMKSLIEGENISINDEVAYRELLESAEEKSFELHEGATKDLIDDFKNQYQYVVDQDDKGKLSLKVNQIGGDKSSEGDTEKKEEESSEKGKTEKKEDESKEGDTEKKEEESSEKGKTEKKEEESSEQKATEKKEESKDTDTTKKQEQSVGDGDILSRMSEILEAVMSGKQQYGRLEETFQELSKKVNDELETLSKKVHNVTKKLKDVENSQFNVSKSLDDTVESTDKREDDLFNSVFSGSPLQTRYENTNDSGNW